ncbi:hypothetical protein D083_2946 [Dickeya solani RNS 08.23.3.1.A]|nr:hypothetical protein D083_2946 [Dickeya solani RNS 08.23.3.1.A]
MNHSSAGEVTQCLIQIHSDLLSIPYFRYWGKARSFYKNDSLYFY